MMLYEEIGLQEKDNGEYIAWQWTGDGEGTGETKADALRALADSME